MNANTNGNEVWSEKQGGEVPPTGSSQGVSNQLSNTNNNYASGDEIARGNGGGGATGLSIPGSGAVGGGGQDSMLRGQTETPVSRIEKVDYLGDGLQNMNDAKQSLDDKLTPNSTPSSSHSDKSFRIKHVESDVKNVEHADGIGGTGAAYTDHQGQGNDPNQLINLFNRSYNASSQDLASNNNKEHQLETEKQMSAEKKDFNNQSVTEIMNYIQHRINLDVRKKIREVPEALPLIRRISHLNTQEDDLFKKVRVGLQNQNKSQAVEEITINCYHDELIEEWKCKQCQNDISKFDIFFDDIGGQVTRFTEILYENQFLSDFKSDFKSRIQMSGTQDQDAQQVLIYKQYQPSNTLELKEYNFMIMCKQIKKQNQAAGTDMNKMSPFGTGEYKNLSGKLLKYLISHNERQKKLKTRYGNDILLFDSIFESGNLLQAERNGLQKDSYNLFMQVDTNTRGHQQWFYFRVKGGVKDKTYTFKIMNFTKPGVTGGKGYKNGEHDMRIFVRSKKTSMQMKDFKRWESLQECHYTKTSVARRKKDVIAAGADSDQEEWVEKAFQQTNNVSTNQNKPNEQQLPTIAVNGVQDQSRNVNNQDGTTKVERTKKRKVFYYYALNFQYTFKHDDDSVYFAFSQPVTYTDILNDLHTWEKKMQPKSQLNEKINNLKKQVLNTTSQKKLPQQKDEVSSQQQQQQEQKKIPVKHRFKKEIVIESSVTNIYYKRVEFCRAISGLPLHKIIIARDYKSSLKNKTILITSRVHSGETPGSQVFKGIFDFLTSEYREAKYLRRFYTFILVPVMNPDGVVCGNYRNSLAGVDLNRQWINPDKNFHPEVCAVKSLMQAIKEEDKRHIWIYCDLHGHSKKNNSFFYGCNTAANGGFLSWTIVRLLPRIFAQKTHMFNYKDCRFRVEPYKIGTARIVAWKQFQITHSFTLENSFYGYDLGEDESRAFTEDDYRTIGTKFILSIYEMHGMWKQIKRELNITHGWLKPRTLNDLTGVPAAQIIAEEAAKKKEEERKQKAIIQYEEFLKKYYKEKKPIMRHYQAYKEQNQAQQLYVPPGVGVSASGKKHENCKHKCNQLKLEDAHDLVDEMPMSESYAMKSKRAESANNNDLDCVKEPDSPAFCPVTAKLPTMQDVDGEEVTEQEFMFKMHQGLVKIQALIRGFLAKKAVMRKRELMSKKQTNLINNLRSRQESGSNSMKRQRSNHVLANSQKKFKYSKPNLPSQANLQAETRTGQSGGTGGFETSSDGGIKATAAGTSKNHNLDSSNDDQLMRANTEQIPQNFSDSSITKISIESTTNAAGSRSGMFGQLRKDPMRLEWRNFFEEDELNRAYQIVEVEQRDETDNDCSSQSMGSNSNPSEDNFDEDEVYRKVYKVDNPEVLIEEKKQREQEFISEVQTDQLTQEQLINQLHTEFKNLNQLKEDQQNQQKQLQLGSNDSKKKLESEKKLVENDDSYKNQQPDDSNKTTPFSKNHNDLDIFSNHALANKTSNKLSIKQSPSNINESQQEIIFQDNQNNRRLLKTSGQQRAFTQQSHNNLTRVNFNQHSRLVQQSYYKIQQSLHGKKPNMNQVIKDCFIIKRMGSNNPVHSSQNFNSSSKLKNIQGSIHNMQGVGGGQMGVVSGHQYQQTINPLPGGGRMSNTVDKMGGAVGYTQGPPQSSNVQIITPGTKGSGSHKKGGAYQLQINQNSMKLGQIQKQYQTHGVIMNTSNEKIMSMQHGGGGQMSGNNFNNQLQQMQSDIQTQGGLRHGHQADISNPQQIANPNIIIQCSQIANSGTGQQNPIQSYQYRLQEHNQQYIIPNQMPTSAASVTQPHGSFTAGSIIQKSFTDSKNNTHGRGLGMGADGKIYSGYQNSGNHHHQHHHSAQKRLNSQSHEQQQYSQLVQSQLNHMQQLSSNSIGKAISKYNKTTLASDSKSNTSQFVGSHLGSGVQVMHQTTTDLGHSFNQSGISASQQNPHSKSNHTFGTQIKGAPHWLGARAQSIEKEFKDPSLAHHIQNSHQIQQKYLHPITSNLAPGSSTNKSNQQYNQDLSNPNIISEARDSMIALDQQQHPRSQQALQNFSSLHQHQWHPAVQQRNQQMQASGMAAADQQNFDSSPKKLVGAGLADGKTVITLASTGPDNQQLTDAQASQLVHQLNQYMKNMTPPQAVEFLRMIQEKNVYITATTAGPMNQRHQQQQVSSSVPNAQMMNNMKGGQNNKYSIHDGSKQKHQQQQLLGGGGGHYQIGYMQQIPIRQDWQVIEKMQRAATMQHRTPHLKPSTVSMPLSLPQKLETSAQTHTSLPIADNNEKLDFRSTNRIVNIHQGKVRDQSQNTLKLNNTGHIQTGQQQNLNIEIEPYKNYQVGNKKQQPQSAMVPGVQNYLLGGQLLESGSAQFGGQQQHLVRKSIVGKSSDQSPTRVIPFFTKVAQDGGDGKTQSKNNMNPVSGQIVVDSSHKVMNHETGNDNQRNLPEEGAIVSGSHRLIQHQGQQNQATDNRSNRLYSHPQQQHRILTQQYYQGASIENIHDDIGRINLQNDEIGFGLNQTGTGGKAFLEQLHHQGTHGQQILPQRIDRERAGQSSTQIMKKDGYFSRKNLYAQQESGTGDMTNGQLPPHNDLGPNTALGMKKNFDGKSEQQSQSQKLDTAPVSGNKYTGYHRQHQQQDYGNKMVHLEAPGSNKISLFQKPKPPSASRVIKPSAQGPNKLIVSPVDSNIQQMSTTNFMNFKQENQLLGQTTSLNKSLNRTFYNNQQHHQQSSTTQLHQLSNQHQLLHQPIVGSQATRSAHGEKKKSAKKESSFVAQPNVRMPNYGKHQNQGIE